MPWVGKNEKNREKGNFLPEKFGGFKYFAYLCRAIEKERLVLGNFHY